MKLLVFNPYKLINKRGLSAYTNDYQIFFQDKFDITVVNIPEQYGRLPSPILFLVFVFYQQIYIPWLCLVKGIDVVFDPSNAYSLLGSFLAKYIFVVHDLTLFRRGKRLSPSGLYLLMLYKLSNYLPVYVATINKLVEKQYSHVFRKRPSFIFENILELEEAYDDAASVYIDPLVTNIFIVSGPGEHKDFGRFVEFLNNFSEIEINVIVAGFGSRESVRSGNTTFTYVGWISSKEINYLYKFCDYNIFHSLDEGFGRPIIEASFHSGRVFVNKRHPACDRVTSADTIIYYSSFEQLFIRIVNKEFDKCQTKASIHNYSPPDITSM